MKKIFALMLVLVLMLSLAACGSFTCDFCNEEKDGDQHEVELFGEEGIACDDCYDDINEGVEALEDLGNSLEDLEF